MEYKLIGVKLPIDLIQAIECQAALAGKEKSAFVADVLKQALLSDPIPPSWPIVKPIDQVSFYNKLDS